MRTTPAVHARIAELTRSRGRLLAPALFVTFLFYVLAARYLGYETPGFPYVYAMCASAVLGTLTLVFVRRWLSDRWCHAAFAALPLVTASSTLVTLGYTPTPGPVILVVIQIAAAGFMLHTGWLVATVGLITAAAIPLAMHIPGLPPMMTIGALVTASTFAVLFHLLMRAAIVRAVTLQLAEAETARTLATKLLEAESLQAQLLHAQRMEAVGTLAAGLAHDMNNVLGAISNLAELLAGNARAEQRADLAQITAHASRGAELTRGLLAFSRRGQYRKRPIQLERVLRDMLPLLGRMLPKSITVRDHLAIDGVCIEADPVQLVQVMMNLALNAADAMDGSGTIEIIGARVADRVRLEVRDHGHGMDAATRLRAFEPFFTTKPQGKGSGLGLAVVWGIVSAHDGSIQIVSQPGQGTTFVIELPTSAVCPTEEPLRTPVTPDRFDRRVVLVVDDERALRETTRRLLARMGLDVLVAENGEEALRVFAAHPEQIQLVVLDMAMPVMGGAECFERLRARSPVPVLIATGYADDERVRDLVGAGAQIIEKPYTAASLREHVANLVELAPLAAAS